jgi:hypothetical protein
MDTDSCFTDINLDPSEVCSDLGLMKDELVQVFKHLKFSSYNKIKNHPIILLFDVLVKDLNKKEIDKLISSEILPLEEELLKRYEVLLELEKTESFPDKQIYHFANPNGLNTLESVKMIVNFILTRYSIKIF